MDKENIKYTIEDTNKCPKIVFIVPYRDREQQKEFFNLHMTNTVLGDYKKEDYKIIFLHQCDNRNFNRGAMKNIGFIFIKEKYPEAYKNITLIFNDVDTLPFTKGFLNYNTEKNIVKHYYGYSYTLGGIVSIKASDFESINGFPNYWSWGYEDNVLQKRILNNKMYIDRSQFYPINDKNIMHFNDTTYRTINEKEYERYKHITDDGINKLSGIEYHYDETNNMVNVQKFETYYKHDNTKDKKYDLKNGSNPFAKKKNIMRMNL
jgi:hypothetical protein